MILKSSNFIALISDRESEEVRVNKVMNYYFVTSKGWVKSAPIRTRSKFFIGEDGSMHIIHGTGESKESKLRKEFGNYFRTKAKAEEALKRMKQVFEKLK